MNPEDLRRGAGSLQRLYQPADEPALPGGGGLVQVIDRSRPLTAPGQRPRIAEQDQPAGWPGQGQDHCSRVRLGSAAREMGERLPGIKPQFFKECIEDKPFDLSGGRGVPPGAQLWV